jgi:hypothetical protein
MGNTLFLSLGERALMPVTRTSDIENVRLSVMCYTDTFITFRSTYCLKLKENHQDGSLCGSWVRERGSSWTGL